MSDELIVNDVAGECPRVGGFSFKRDATKGLWLTPTHGPVLLSWPVNDVVFGSAVFAAFGGSTEQPTPPATASALWESPDTVTGEIVGYRAWNYEVTIADDSTPLVFLKSVRQDYLWSGPVVTSDRPPRADTNTGLYAIGLDDHHKSNFDSYVVGAQVWGRVAMSGTVVEGTNGYRAERMAIQELWVNPTPERDDDDERENSPEGLCKLLGDRYQCDATVRRPCWKGLLDAVAKQAAA